MVNVQNHQTINWNKEEEALKEGKGGTITASMIKKYVAFVIL